MSTATSADGTTIDYDAYGSGPAVVFIGGATQFRAIDARTTTAAKLLAERGFTAVDYDRRGRGRSGDHPDWSVEREVADVAALIAAVGGTATLYASSSGATVALPAAAAGIGVTGLVLYEPPFFPGADNSDKITELRRLLDAGDHDAAMRHGLTAVIGVAPEMVEGIAASPAWPAMVSVAPTLRYDFTALNDITLDPDWPTRWAGVTVPVAVLSGDRTFPGMPEAADAVAAALPTATRTVLPGQDHGPEPRVLADALAAILE
ncbi:MULTISPECIES: alpha/beta fold hydrolase [Actinokineospora]|nr:MULTISPECIES: alpha/beta hydrolase [Actinokineospora]